MKVGTVPWRPRAGRNLLAALLVLTTAYALGADTGATHLFNPAWPPHARFHLVQFLAMLTFDMGLGLWLLFGGKVPSRVGACMVVILLLAFWTPILWITGVVPGTDLRAADVIPVPVIAGIRIYLNVVAAGVASALALLGGWWASRPEPAEASMGSSRRSGGRQR